MILIFSLILISFSDSVLILILSIDFVFDCDLKGGSRLTFEFRNRESDL